MPGSDGGPRWATAPAYPTAVDCRTWTLGLGGCRWPRLQSGLQPLVIIEFHPDGSRGHRRPKPNRLTSIPFKWAQVTASCYLGFAENRGNQEAATRMPRGQCTLPADEAGRILDRLAGLEQIIRPDDLRQALTATGRLNTGVWVLP